MKVFLNLTEKILFCLGFCLFIINIIGLFISLRNESIYQEKSGIHLTEKELYHSINKTVMDKKEYITNLNEAVNQGIAHYWRDAGINKYNLRIPFYENYLLFIASYLDPEEYLKYEFYDYRRAIERGVGSCSQQAIIVMDNPLHFYYDVDNSLFFTGTSEHDKFSKISFQKIRAG